MLSVFVTDFDALMTEAGGSYLERCGSPSSLSWWMIEFPQEPHFKKCKPLKKKKNIFQKWTVDGTCRLTC